MDDSPDGGRFSTPRMQRGSGRGGSSSSAEDLQSRTPSPDESLGEEEMEKMSSLDTEDGEDQDVDSSLDSSVGSSLKERCSRGNSNACTQAFSFCRHRLPIIKQMTDTGLRTSYM